MSKKKRPLLPGLHTHVPPVERQRVELEWRDGVGWCWPQGEGAPQQPQYYALQQPLPCPQCSRVRDQSLSQAVTCLATHNGVAYLHCRPCGHRFKLAIR